jgi:8-amino-7-oxononanoate synthase
MPALNAVLEEARAHREQEGRVRTLSLREAPDSAHIREEGREYLSFMGNDYLGLSHHPQVVRAAEKALEQYGAGAGASRVLSGNHPEYKALEAALAASKQREAALVFGSGYLANLGIFSSLLGEGDIVFADKLAHACMLDGIALSGATLVRFAHNDMAHLKAQLEAHRGRGKQAIIATEHVFSMDGDIAPIYEIVSLAKAYDCWSMVDDAHGLGIVDSDAYSAVDIWMGTLSKAAGNYGGYVLGSRALVAHMINHARSFLFTTALPPATIAGARAALEVMQREPDRAENVRKRAHQCCEALGLPYHATPIVPLLLGDASRALEAADALKKHGIFVSAIRPPTVPPNTARLRFSFSAEHTQADIAKLVQALRTENLVP